jgi:signal transduction histidine kinase
MAVDEERAREKVVGLVKDLEEANQRLRIYAFQVEELATTRERNRLAREIHDGLGHYLTTINIQLKAARAVLMNDPAKAETAIQTAQNLSQEALVDVRHSVAALRAAPEDDLPLEEQMERLLARCEAAGIKPQLTVLGQPRPLSPQVHLTLYRSAQEGVNNVCKHASAANLWAELDYSQPGSIRLLVRDDGQGAESLEGGFGLLGLRERVNLLNGVFHAKSIVGGGVILEIVVPQDENENSNSVGG